MRQAIQNKFRESRAALAKTSSVSQAREKGPSDSQNLTRSGWNIFAQPACLVGQKGLSPPFLAIMNYIWDGIGTEYIRRRDIHQCTPGKKDTKYLIKNWSINHLYYCQDWRGAGVKSVFPQQRYRYKSGRLVRYWWVFSHLNCGHGSSILKWYE